jgi:hypothetical protein
MERDPLTLVVGVIAVVVPLTLFFGRELCLLVRCISMKATPRQVAPRAACPAAPSTHGPARDGTGRSRRLFLRGSAWHAATPAVLVTACLLGGFVVVLFRVFTQLHGSWRGWCGVAVVVATIGAAPFGAELVVRFWNHPRFLGRWIAYLAFLALTSSCLLGLWLQSMLEL